MQDDLPNFSIPRQPVNGVPVESILRTRLELERIPVHEIDAFQFIPLHARRHCGDCLVRWKNNGDTILAYLKDVLEPLENRKHLGSDTLIRGARLRKPDYPGGNTFAPFDLRATALVLPWLLSEVRTRPALSDYLFNAGWRPPQAK